MARTVPGRRAAAPIVVKLGGSLLEGDGGRGRPWLDILARSTVPVVVVPGGGAFADLVRSEQRRLGFSGRTAHRMALVAMHQTALAIVDGQWCTVGSSNIDPLSLLLNLEGVPYIDSAGLGEVVRTYTTVSRQGGSLKLLNLTKRIEDVGASSTRTTTYLYDVDDKLTEIQARAILDMRLQRLTQLERHKIVEEHQQVVALIEELRVGPPRARVEDVSVTWDAPTDSESTFSIWY